MSAQRVSTLTSSSIGLIKGDKTVVNSLTVASSWEGGTNILTALRIDPKTVRGWLALEVTKLIKSVGANNTLQDTDEVIDLCDAIIDEFPALKMEEIAYVFRQIKRGKILPKLYGSFKMREFMDAFREYEGSERADYLERKHHIDDRHERTSGTREEWRPICLTEQELKDIGIWPTESSSQSSSSVSSASESPTTSKSKSE